MPKRLKMVDWDTRKGKYKLQDTETLIDIIMVTDTNAKLIIEEWFKEKKKK